MSSVKRGEIYYADLSPVVGSEQGGMRPVLIVLTALAGGALFAAAIAVLLNLSQHIELFFIGGVIIAILGMLFQFSATDD
jgi:hypothetical protein